MFDDRRTKRVGESPLSDETRAPTGHVALTFDNLGEATELERGTWRADRPLGSHPSVTVALPRLLEVLAAHGLTATFFLEGINCELYPDAVRAIAEGGHEIGLHGWRHEAWGGLDAAAQASAIGRGMRAFEQLGIRVRGFRPPGGKLTRHSARLLGEAGIEWTSPAEGAEALTGVLAQLPFDWAAVDAYQLTPRFEDLRRARGDPPEGRTASEVLELFSSRLNARRPGPDVLVLHPFLMVEGPWWDCVRRLLERIADQVRDGGLWAGPGGVAVRPSAPG
jgi:peptidoglycan/xylan/chitin deacetylase (PgdA/CDA1 family)